MPRMNNYYVTFRAAKDYDFGSFTGEFDMVSPEDVKEQTARDLFKRDYPDCVLIELTIKRGFDFIEPRG